MPVPGVSLLAASRRDASAPRAGADHSVRSRRRMARGLDPALMARLTMNPADCAAMCGSSCTLTSNTTGTREVTRHRSTPDASEPRERLDAGDRPQSRRAGVCELVPSRTSWMHWLIVGSGSCHQNQRRIGGRRTSIAIATPSGIDARRASRAKKANTPTIQSTVADAFMRRRVMKEATASGLERAVSKCTHRLVARSAHCSFMLG